MDEALGPWVLIHGKRDAGVDAQRRTKPLFLGQHGFSEHRSHALSFATREEAGTYAIAGARETPALFRDAGVKVAHHPYVKDEDHSFAIRKDDAAREPLPGTDYDPY